MATDTSRDLHLGRVEQHTSPGAVVQLLARLLQVGGSQGWLFLLPETASAFWLAPDPTDSGCCSALKANVKSGFSVFLSSYHYHNHDLNLSFALASLKFTSAKQSQQVGKLGS